MLILHFSLTPLAGSPIRICRALNMLESIESRLVLLDPKGYVDREHPIDLVWGCDNDEILDLLERADVIHLHNSLGLQSKQFSPINFERYWQEGKPMVRQFHSTPNLVARMAKEDVSSVLSCPIPKVVISQYPERFYENSRLVPNIVFDLEEFTALERDKNAIRIGYSPSNFRSSRSTRWDTKGYPETIKVLKSVIKKANSSGLNVELDIIEQVTHAECLRRKALCDISIDDLVTGSYHLSTLESLMLGSLAISFTDDRVQNAIREISGRDDFPAVNVRLEDLEHVLSYLIERPELVREIGSYSRQWMVRRWAPERMAQKFVGIYHEVISNPHASFPSRFSLRDDCGHFLNQGIYDILWESRHERWPKEIPKILKFLKSNVGSLVRRIGLRQ